MSNKPGDTGSLLLKKNPKARVPACVPNGRITDRIWPKAASRNPRRIHLKSTSWKDTAELIGIAAIVASLIFVGLQMKQNHEIALAGQYQARAEVTLDLYSTFVEIDDIPNVPALRNRISETVTARSIAEILWLWIAMDNHYYQYKSGFLDEESWQAQLRNIKAIYAVCEVRFVWDWRKNGLRADFVEMVESVGSSCDE